MRELVSHVVHQAVPEDAELPPELFEGTVSQEEIDGEVMALRDRHATIEETGGPAEKGDFVLLESASGRRLVNTGCCFGNAAESPCLGRSVGDEVVLDGVGPWEVASIRRKVCPPFTDGLAASEGFSGCQAFLDNAYQRLSRRLRQRMLLEVADSLGQQLVAKSTFELDADELERYEKIVSTDMPSDPEEIREYLGAFGLDAEGVTSPEDATRRAARQMLEGCALGTRLMEKRGESLDDKDYHRYLERMAKEVGITVEEARASEDEEAFRMERTQREITRYSMAWIRKNETFSIGRGE